MGEKGKVTIYDLAEQLHTTASTVSRALQNNPRISLKMREAVQKLARDLNYIPDPVAHHLRTGKGNVLGIVVPRIDRNFFATIISSFQNTAAKYGYQVIIAASNESQEQEESAIKALISKKVDGIALSLSVQTQESHYDAMLAVHNIPLVYFDRLPMKNDADFVTNDNFQVGYDAVKQLHKIGCRRIAHFAGSQAQKAYADRFNGYKKALEDLQIGYHPEWVFNNTITIESGTEAAQKILQMGDNRPDGIFSAGDFPAVSAIDIFRHKGLSVPQDIAIIGVANEPLDNYLSTPLTSFDLHQQRIGEMTANILLSRMGEIDEMAHPAHLIVNHDLILRESSI